jgi:hypothetical protein
MRSVLGVAMAAFAITPAFADYYIVQEPTTRRCTILEERPTGGGSVIRERETTPAR